MTMLASLLFALPLAVTGETPVFDPGPGVGQTLPAFELPDQDGRPRGFASLSGPDGLVLVFFRSADW